MEPILSVEHLSVTFIRYGRGLSRMELPAVRDVSLTVEPGRVTAVAGESGSGKSLLAHAILGLLPRNARVGEVSATAEPSSLRNGRRPSGAGRSPSFPRELPTWTP